LEISVIVIGVADLYVVLAILIGFPEDINQASTG